MKKTLLACTFLAGLTLTPVITLAEDINAIFKKVDELIVQKNYPKALDELGWAKKEIERLNSQQLATFLPDTLGGFTGGKLETNAALGFSNLERQYSKPDGSITVSLTGGSGTAAGGIGGLAALGKMAAMMGNGDGQDTVRIAGRTATVSENGSPEVTVFLDSGSVLQFRSTGALKTSDLKAFAELVKIDEMEKYLRGQ